MVIYCAAVVLVLFNAGLEATSPYDSPSLSNIGRPSNCFELQMMGYTTSGIYTIYPRFWYNVLPFDVYCDMETDGGGWTVFQRRAPAEVHINFTRPWKDYKQGFGDLMEEFWLDGKYQLPSGMNCTAKPTKQLECESNRIATAADKRNSISLSYVSKTIDYRSFPVLHRCRKANYANFKSNDFLHVLSNQDQVTLRIDLKVSEGNASYATYGNFQVGNENSGYYLTVGQFSGESDKVPGDSFTWHNETVFVTYDKNDVNNCSKICKGGWWYKRCHATNLNGLYLNGAHASYADGIEWSAWTNHYYSMIKTEMKIRPKRE